MNSLNGERGVQKDTQFRTIQSIIIIGICYFRALKKIRLKNRFSNSQKNLN